MIKIYKYEDLGGADYEWLKTKYHFSFSSYYNPGRMGFGKLRVINDDLVKAGTGFDTHPHRDMEIITYVRSGAITHKDSQGNKGRTEAGDVQVMSAGSGIRHSEHNMESEDTTLYQIWIEPHTKGVKPDWGMAKFPKKSSRDNIPLLVSGRKKDMDKDVLHINQYASIYGGRIAEGSLINHGIEDQAYILIAEGKITIDGNEMRQGDGCEISKQKSVKINSITESEIVIIDVPA